MNKTRGILLIAGIVGISLLGAFFFRDKGLGATLPVAGQTYTLAGSGITASNTSSITLSSLTIPQTGYKLQDSDFSPTFYLTFEPGSTKRQEIASCTTVVQNANNSATLSGCTRGLLPFTPFTASSSYAFSHAGGTSVIFSDPPQLFNEFVAKDNDATITGLINFTQLPLGPTSTPTNQQQFITLYQFQQATTTGGVNGSETAKGVFEGATQAEMAAGTEFGSTGATLVALNKYATSTGPGAGGIAGYHFPVTDSDGYLNASFCGKAFGCASLNGSGQVYQNPQSATTAASANGIPIADSNGKLGAWITRYGTGTDGALSISSGTTTIDLGGASQVTKNYTSVSITGSGALAFSNANTSGTIITFRVQGNFTVSSTASAAIDLRGVGAAGGIGGVTAGGGIVVGTNGKQFIYRVGGTSNQFGVGGNAVTTTGGVAIDTIWQNYYSISTGTALFNGNIVVLPGAGGGGGASGNDGGSGVAGNGGAGGAGGGAMIVYVGGAYSVTGTINMAGTDGSSGTAGDGGSVGSGGSGGGGGGGMFVALYNLLTRDGATYTVTGGSGVASPGDGGSGAGGAGGSGAGSITTNGATGGAGDVPSAGWSGAGGNGQAGFAVRMLDLF